MLFSELLKKLAIRSRLPFDLDFSICPPGVNSTTIPILGREWPVYGDLLVRERFFLQMLQQERVKDLVDLQIDLERLAYQINQDLEINSLKVSRAVLAGGTEGEDERAQSIRESEGYEQWALNNHRLIEELTEKTNRSSDTGAAGYLSLAAFLLSRSAGEFGLEDLMSLSGRQYQVLKDYFDSELSPEQADEVEEEPDTIEDLGNDSEKSTTSTRKRRTGGAGSGP